MPNELFSSQVFLICCGSFGIITIFNLVWVHRAVKSFGMTMRQSLKYYTFYFPIVKVFLCNVDGFLDILKMLS